MPFKLNIATKDGKTFKIESESEVFIDKSLGETIDGAEISSDFYGYQFKISGASDKAGLPSRADVQGIGLKRLLLTYGNGMWVSRPKGLRLRKTTRGKVISKDIVQINLTIIKQGAKTLTEIFPDQNKANEVAVVPTAVVAAA